ncbi:MAG: MFS transporter [Spirochaetaceae bacterium]|nr:MFS transporter [Spirochaetaceae bacterium]
MTAAIAAGDDGLTPRQMRAAQRNFTLFSFLNVVSFHLLTGNLIALYALRLGAGDLLVGVLYSFFPLGQLVPLLGRLIVRRLGTVRTMGIFWIARYALMSPILLAPLFANSAAPVSIWLIVAAAVGFNLARGVAITGHNAIVGAITTETERGSFLSRNQLVIHAAGIGAGLAIGLLLQEQSPLWLYSLLMGAGIVIGLSSTRLVFRFPEPPAPDRSGGFFASLGRTLRRTGVPRFLVLLALHSFAVSMVIPFLVVYAKRVHGLGDNTAMLLGAVGAGGAIAMALVSAFVIDRVGAKPLITLFTATLAVTTVMLAVAPTLDSMTAVWVYLGFVFFFANFGASGGTSANSVYYFNLTPSADRLNLGILYFLVIGIPASLGSLGGGLALDRLASIRVLETSDVYRIYFGAVAAAYVGIVLLASRLERLGAYRVHDLLGLFASPRDLRALALLHRLKGSRTPDNEQSLVRRLGDARSRLAAPDLLRRLDSPRFAVRSEALDSLADMPATDELTRALIAEVAGQPFTTAHKAADLIGRKRLADGVEVLRTSLASPDVYLVGKAMVSLARLGDQASRATIEELFRSTRNPRLLIHGAAALELFGDPASLDDVLAVLEWAPRRYVRDEVVLSAAGILEMANSFYPLYQGFLADARRGLALLTDYVAEQQERARLEPAALHLVTALVATFADLPAFRAASGDALELIPVAVRDVPLTATLTEALQRPVTGALDHYRFLLAATVAFYAWRRL